MVNMAMALYQSKEKKWCHSRMLPSPVFCCSSGHPKYEEAFQSFQGFWRLKPSQELGSRVVFVSMELVWFLEIKVEKSGVQSITEGEVWAQDYKC